MNAPEVRAELAVTNALRQLGARTGDPLNLKRVEQLWKEYGIRASDLHGAIERMSSSDRLMLIRHGDHDGIALTPAGEAWSRAQPAWIEYSLLVPRRIRVAENFRSLIGRAAGPLSRKNDMGQSTTFLMIPAMR